MGKYEKGILGSFKGQVGTVVGSTWRGMEVMKSKRKSSTTKPTQKQVIQQARFTFVGKFIASLTKLFSITFNDRSGVSTGPNNAFQYNYAKALGGVYPTFTLDYSKVLISKGTLAAAKAPTVVVNAEELKFSWTDNSASANANATDKCIMVVHCPEMDLSIYKTGGAARTAGTDTIDVEQFSGKTVQTWLAFMNADENEVSISNYTGQFAIA